MIFANYATISILQVGNLNEVNRQSFSSDPQLVYLFLTLPIFNGSLIRAKLKAGCLVRGEVHDFP